MEMKGVVWTSCWSCWWKELPWQRAFSGGLEKLRIAPTAELPWGEDAALCYEEGISIRAYMPSSQHLPDPHLCESQCLPHSFHHLLNSQSLIPCCIYFLHNTYYLLTYSMLFFSVGSLFQVSLSSLQVKLHKGREACLFCSLMYL